MTPDLDAHRARIQYWAGVHEFEEHINCQRHLEPFKSTLWRHPKAFGLSRCSSWSKPLALWSNGANIRSHCIHCVGSTVLALQTNNRRCSMPDDPNKRGPADRKRVSQQKHEQAYQKSHQRKSNRVSMGGIY